MVFLVLVNNRRKFWSLTSVASILLTLVSLSLSLTKKLLAWLVLALTKGLDVASGVAPGLSERRQTGLSLASRHMRGSAGAGGGETETGLWIENVEQGAAGQGRMSLQENPLTKRALEGRHGGGAGGVVQRTRGESTWNPLADLI